MDNWEHDKEIKIFREYLRIPSVHPNVDYEPCVKFLTEQAINLQLPYKIHYTDDNLKKPVFIISWYGTQPELPTILVNSHMDVVPVFEDKWNHPPFAAEIDEQGRIFGRGSQDCKCVGMQYLAAIRSLKRSGMQPIRTLHVIFVPDEEIGGDFGMKPFCRSEEFKNLNVGFALDEGSATDDQKFVAHYAERTIWQINFKFNGSAGHGSLLLKNTAGQKFNYILNKLFSLRSSELKRLEDDPMLRIGDVTSINLTMLNGGVQSNVIPPQLEACFDMRIAIDVNLIEFENMLRKWCFEAGEDIELEWIQRSDTAPATKIDESCPYWCAFQRAFQKMGHVLETQVFVGGTDGQYLREVGIPCIGFSPMNETPTLMHDHNEYLKADTYLRGIEIYKEIFKQLLSLEF